MRAAHERCIPWTATLELSTECPLRCVHCYNFDRAGPPAARPAMSGRDWTGVIDALRRLGGHQVTFTGGEPLAVPAIWRLLDHAARRGMAAALVTGGTALTEAVAGRLAGYEHLVDVAISFYGVGPATHDRVTGRAGSFDRSRAGARRLIRDGVPVTFKFVVMDVNVGEAEAMPAMGRDEGAHVEINTCLHPRHTGDLGVLARRAPLPKLERAYRGPLRPTLPDGATPHELVCNCARSNCAVAASGDVYPCISVPMRCGNVLERPFERIWEESPQLLRLRSLTPSDFRACEPCPLRSTCRRRPGPAYVLTGDYTGVDPWACAEADLVRRILFPPPQPAK
jgi:radical SAM protein with 4Fe4S-binding SPASM domain